MYVNTYWFNSDSNTLVYILIRQKKVYCNQFCRNMLGCIRRIDVNPGRRNRKGLLYRSVTALCGFLTDHGLSVTEKGSNGGRHMDCNCRWCDKGIKVPLVECDMSYQLRSLVERLRRDTSEGNEFYT